MNPWRNKEFTQRALLYAKSLTEKWDIGILGERCIQGVSGSDVAQEALITAIKYGKDNPCFISRNIKWGVLKELQRIKKLRKAIPYENHGSDDLADHVLKNLPAKELRTDILVEVNDTIDYALKAAGLTEEEQLYYKNYICYGILLVPHGRLQEMQRKIQRVSDKLEYPLDNKGDT